VAREKLVPEKDKRVVRMDEYLAINVMGKKTFYGDLIDRKTLAEKYARSSTTTAITSPCASNGG
jgi:hypothetical protein